MTRQRRKSEKRLSRDAPSYRFNEGNVWSLSQLPHIYEIGISQHGC